MAGKLARTNAAPPAPQGSHSLAHRAPAKKHAAKKHPAKKHAAKHVGEKHASKHAAKKHAKKAARHVSVSVSGKVLPWGDPRPQDDDSALAQAFHHMQRAGAVISLLEPASGGDLKALLEHGIDLYRSSAGGRRKSKSVQCAAGLLRAAEHLGMAGLYAARREHHVDAPIPSREEIAHHLDTLDGRLNGISLEARSQGERLKAIARELLRQAENATDDLHLEYELTMAADGICSALEAGL